MLKLRKEEIYVLIYGQKDSKSKIRHVCPFCKRKRYIKYLKIAECGQCLICRNTNRCKRTNLKIVEKL